MNKEQEVRLFANLHSTHPGLKTWLELQLAEAEEYLLNHVEPHMLYRAQGNALTIRKMLTLLEKAPQIYK